jgi:hypothetical protein
VHCSDYKALEKDLGGHMAKDECFVTFQLRNAAAPDQVLRCVRVFSQPCGLLCGFSGSETEASTARILCLVCGQPGGPVQILLPARRACWC